LKFTLAAGGATEPRAGTLNLGHGEVQTPAFMPVGTRGTVKAVDTEDLRHLGVDILLGNAYHLWQAPGDDAVAAAGGLHQWMGWSGNILTDSGGFQAVSLVRAGVAAVDDGGIDFSTDAGTQRLTPEGAVGIQERLAPDVMMTLDHPLYFPAAAEEAAAATARTHRWAERCAAAWSRGSTELFGIVQGGFESATRSASAQTIRAIGFPGYGIGGLSLGEPADLSLELILVANAILEVGKPRYLMGVGSEPEMLDAIGAGVDMFDCVWPTRLARTGAILVGAGRVNIKGRALADDHGPLELGCACPACTRHGRAQVRYLFMRGELLGYRLLTIHNVHHVLELVRGARAAILAGGYAEFVRARLAPIPA
jgi:queuine tRNA-ribosyltransferase